MNIVDVVSSYKRNTELFGRKGANVLFSRKVARKMGRSDRGDEIVLDCRTFLHPLRIRVHTSDWDVLRQILVDREYEDPREAHASALRRYIEQVKAQGSTPVIVDCGANIGLAAIWYATRYPDVLIFAVEPEPSNVRLLEFNTASYETIVPVARAISDRATRVTLSNAGPDPWGWRTQESEGGGTPTVTINELLASRPDLVPVIVKIDIEGAETDLMRSNLEWLRQTPCVVFEGHDWLLPWRGTTHSILKPMMELGPYDFVQKGENMFAYSHRLAPS